VRRTGIFHFIPVANRTASIVPRYEIGANREDAI
jgi:hypothetical protein